MSSPTPVPVARVAFGAPRSPRWCAGRFRRRVGGWMIRRRRAGGVDIARPAYLSPSSSRVGARGRPRWAGAGGGGYSRSSLLTTPPPAGLTSGATRDVGYCDMVVWVWVAVGREGVVGGDMSSRYLKRPHRAAGADPQARRAVSRAAAEPRPASQRGAEWPPVPAQRWHAQIGTANPCQLAHGPACPEPRGQRPEAPAAAPGRQLAVVAQSQEPSPRGRCPAAAAPAARPCSPVASGCG